MKKITKEEFLKRATAKNIKQMRGHDAPSYEWDIYFDNKKICNCWDDSWGGELQITNYNNQSIEDIYNSIDKDTLWDKQYKWTTSLDILMEDLLNIAYQNKDFEKNQKKGLLLGTNKKDNYRIISWGNVTIPTLLKKYGNKGRDVIQQGIQKHKDKENILNKEYLMSLGFTF
jgi:hypothetical protein